MVDDVHAAVWGGAGGSVEAAFGEGGVGGVVGGFEEVGEFVEDVGGCGWGGAVVWVLGWGERISATVGEMGSLGKEGRDGAGERRGGGKVPRKTTRRVLAVMSSWMVGHAFMARMAGLDEGIKV